MEVNLINLIQLPEQTALRITFCINMEKSSLLRISTKKIWVFRQTQLLPCSHVFCGLCTIFNEKYINVNLEWFCRSISTNGSSSTTFCEELEHPEKGRQPTTNSTHFRMHGQRKWERGEEKKNENKNKNTYFTTVCMIIFF